MLLKLNLHATGLCTTNHPALSLSLRATHSFFGGRGGVVVVPHCPLQKTWVALPRLLSSQVLLSPSFVGQCWWQEWLPLVKWQQQTTSQTLSACWLVLSLISWISVTESVFACSIFKNFYFPHNWTMLTVPATCRRTRWSGHYNFYIYIPSTILICYWLSFLILLATSCFKSLSGPNA